MTQTIYIDVRDYWIPLEGVENGVLLQKISGSPLYYTYSDTRPDNSLIGHIEPIQNEPSPLFGGNIWVRSKNFARIAYTPSPVTPPDLASQIGDLNNLPTNNKESIVDSIIELESRITETETGQYYTYTHILLPVEITNKSLTLPHHPVRSSVRIVPVGGPEQFLDIDFTVQHNSNVVEWATLALELLVEAGEKLNISYLKV